MIATLRRAVCAGVVAWCACAAGPVRADGEGVTMLKSNPTRMSDRGIAFLRDVEGCRLDAYKDVAGIWTIGVGHTGPDVHEGMRATVEQCDRWLREDVREAESAVTQYVAAPITQQMFDALCSFTFNLGGESLRRSTLLRCLNKRNYQDAAAEFRKWRKAGNMVVAGLERRRIREAQMFLSSDDATGHTPDKEA